MYWYGNVNGIHDASLSGANFLHGQACVRQVSGMTCSACSSAVEAALDAVPGVDNAVVSLIQQQARVEYDTAATTPVRLDICKQLTELCSWKRVHFLCRTGLEVLMVSTCMRF